MRVKTRNKHSILFHIIAIIQDVVDLGSFSGGKTRHSIQVAGNWLVKVMFWFHFPMCIETQFSIILLKHLINKC